MINILNYFYTTTAVVLHKTENYQRIRGQRNKVEGCALRRKGDRSLLIRRPCLYKEEELQCQTFSRYWKSELITLLDKALNYWLNQTKNHLANQTALITKTSIQFLIMWFSTEMSHYRASSFWIKLFGGGCAMIHKIFVNHGGMSLLHINFGYNLITNIVASLPQLTIDAANKLST